MKAEHVEVLVEEPSMEAALERLLPKLLDSATFQVHSHQGKKDLLAKLGSRLRGYAAWIPENWRIVVIVDQDDDDCRRLKATLEKAAAQTQLPTRRKGKTSRWTVLNRIAIEELEAWYFGDWSAVRAAYPRATASIPTQSKYRNPDAIQGGTWEAFERVMQQHGYFEGGLRKIEAARTIAAHMDPARNTSPSFCALRDALFELSSA